ncbi:hypothetical protein G6W55_36440 [Streptomyces sp. CAI-85]|uniref:Uncharacterized protein n=1 Tax=Streptomyces antibioticus TaxID=1890 RepID=A0AAE7CJF1_STRAT|nr:hypothetical protein [Streptomyces sp. CAI-85]QIT43445.1 hypothetical protein HCX60_07860 [Streptomyces antibioticus]
MLDRPAAVLRVRRGLGRGARGGVGLGCGQVLGLVWQEDSSCAIRFPRSGPGGPIVAIPGSGIAFRPL